MHTYSFLYKSKQFYKMISCWLKLCFVTKHTSIKLSLSMVILKLNQINYITNQSSDGLLRSSGLLHQLDSFQAKVCQGVLAFQDGCAACVVLSFLLMCHRNGFLLSRYRFCIKWLCSGAGHLSIDILIARLVVAYKTPCL